MQYSGNVIFSFYFCFAESVICAVKIKSCMVLSKRFNERGTNAECFPQFKL